MLDHLKNLFRRQETPRSLTFSFDGIPALVARERDDAAARLSAATEGDRAMIRDAAARLQEVIRILQAARFEEGIHPKLKSIAQKSLPLYTRAVGAALEKTLPDAPEEFYAAAAELLKTCISSAQGQGKYLRTAFPEEMKAVSACVTGIGRAINAMNVPLQEYRVAMARAGEAARLHAALADIATDRIRSSEKEARLSRRRAEIREQLAAARLAAGDLEKERGGPEIAAQQAEIRRLTEDRDRAARTYAALSMTASHVLRKAEKIAHRQMKPLDEKGIARAVTLLSDHAIASPEDLADALPAAFDSVRRMVDAGDVILKNREERTLFATSGSFMDGLLSMSREHAGLAARCAGAERALSSNPVIARLTAMEREIRSLSETLAREEEACANILQWRENLARTVPSLQEELKKVMGMIMSGSDVQIHYPDE